MERVGDEEPNGTWDGKLPFYRTHTLPMSLRRSPQEVH